MDFLAKIVIPERPRTSVDNKRDQLLAAWDLEMRSANAAAIFAGTVGNEIVAALAAAQAYGNRPYPTISTWGNLSIFGRSPADVMTSPFRQEIVNQFAQAAENALWAFTDYRILDFRNFAPD